MRNIVCNPIFVLGLLLRVILLVTILPTPVSIWYAPFLEATAQPLGLDPWAAWLAQGGTPEAFPYGYVMWLIFLPLTVLSKALGAPVALGYGSTLLVADVAVLEILRRMVPGRDKLLLITYWCSPIIIVGGYFLGYNDIVPIMLLLLAAHLIRTKYFFGAGIVATLATSAKLSMLLPLPIFLLMLFNNRSYREHLHRFGAGIGLAASIVILPFVGFSTAGMHMIQSNPKMENVYRLTVDLGDGTMIYLLPLAYVLLLYSSWRIKRMQFEFFTALLGITFLLVLILTPASLGWFIWAIPFLVLYQARSDRVATILVASFSALYVGSSLMISLSPALVQHTYLNLQGFGVSSAFQSKLASMLHTAMVAIGAILAVRMWREALANNDFFWLSRKPFTIAIAGDSGAGKDMYSNALTGLFGAHSVTTVSGDDYHLWDRPKSAWKTITHLNPAANDLARFSDDLVRLVDGKSIQSRHYNHETGRLGRIYTKKSNDFIIASGLHAVLATQKIRCCDLAIYLDTDENLRRYFKLKRDVEQRGRTMEDVYSIIEKRAPDSAKFIRPQAAQADLIFALLPYRENLHHITDESPLHFRLRAQSSMGFDDHLLSKVLVGYCGLHVETIKHKDLAGSEILIEGNVPTEHVARAAALLCPKILDFLDVAPEWQGGTLGLMQLITLSYIHQLLLNRFL